ncbi:MAG: hypothetical protein EA402_05340 [Planctomycetota bacterium]|nr:MAG: hypothetical protein EA402_05340 [Planctomycetota bacterium]
MVLKNRLNWGWLMAYKLKRLVVTIRAGAGLNCLFWLLVMFVVDFDNLAIFVGLIGFLLSFFLYWYARKAECFINTGSHSD